MTKYPAYISIRAPYKTTHDATGIPSPGGKTFNVEGALLHRLVPCRRAGEAGTHWNDGDDIITASNTQI